MLQLLSVLNRYLRYKNILKVLARILKKILLVSLFNQKAKSKISVDMFINWVN